MKKAKILLVDDKKENIFALEEILENLVIDAELITALSGNEAVAQCLQTEFALILLDVQMPGMDGFETISLIHKDSLNQDTPVIFISAIYSEDFYKIKGLTAGAVDFIAKPIVEGVLLGKVNVFLLMYQHRRLLIEQMEQIQSLNRDIENFNRIMAHDIRQPLTVIKGAIYLVLSELENIPDEIKNILDSAERSCKNMEDLISEVLEFLRIRSIEIDYNEFKPTILLENMKTEVIEKSKKPVTIDIPEIPPIKSNLFLFTSIFRNLIENSVKYNENETIDIALQFEENQDSCIFKIKDNGIGIPKENYNNIFQPFERGSTAGKYPGTGVGLSIVRSAVEKLGGKIYIEKSGAEGTTISFSLKKI